MNNLVKDYIEQNKQNFVDELFELLRIPSVSANSKHYPDMLKTAEVLKQKLVAAGAENVEICSLGEGIPPVVYGDKIIDPKYPTVIVYGHYDVIPVEPLELWHSDPFEPVIKVTEEHPEGAIFGRGSCDDKGQLYMHIKAFEYLVKTKTLACNVKFMIEGEEEVGSTHLGDWIIKNKEKYKGDTIVISDTSIISKDTPSIQCGLRGLSYMEVEVTGPNRDLHSGTYGGAVANPANILSKMIASLHDENNNITIKGFYDNVVDLNADQRAELAKSPFSEEAYKKSLGINSTWGEKGYTALERATIRPTLDVNGIWSGYIGEGSKTVLPSKASAKISMRLVPNQTSTEISEKFKKHFEDMCPPYVTVKVTTYHGGNPFGASTDSIPYLAAEKAMIDTFGKKPVPTRSGASIPIVALFEKELGLKSLLMGFGLDSDAIHSPNEKYGLFNYYKGIETIIMFYKHYAELNKK